MKLKSKIKLYTSQAAFDWVMKKLVSVSSEDKKDWRLKKMNADKIKIVIKVYEDE